MDAGNFTEDEKRFVLAEYIKASQVDTQQLVAFIQQCELRPDWFSMQVPGGRNLHQCIRAASSMLGTDLDPSLPDLRKRKSGEFSHEPGQKRQALAPHSWAPPSHLQPQIPSHPLASPQLPPQIHSQPRPPGPALPPHATQPMPEGYPLASPQLPPQMQLQPRPPASAQSQASVLPPQARQPTPEGYGVFQSNTPRGTGYSVFPSNPSGKKRGRPKKAEKDAQARLTINPVPISPRPAMESSQGQIAPTPLSAIQHGQGHGAPAPALPSHNPLHATYGGAPPATSGDLRDSRRGSVGGQQAPPPVSPYQHYPERRTSAIASEKSPSIGNLVTTGPPVMSQLKHEAAQGGRQGGGASPPASS